MKSTYKVLIMVVPISVCLLSCNNNPTRPNNPPTNLITNPDFDLNGQLSLDGWTVDTSLAAIVQDTPPDDGKRSLQLEAGWNPQEGFARTYVSGLSGTGVYKLVVWTKSFNSWPGRITIGQWAQGGWLNSKQVLSVSSDWHQVTVLDTMLLANSDSIAVHLSAGSTEVALGRVLFADVILQKIQ